MEEHKSNQRLEGHPEGCRCFLCGHMMGKDWSHGWCCTSGRHRFVLRLVLGIIILAIVFSLGVKIGELKGAFGYRGYGDYYGHYRMMYPYYNEQQQPYPMMGGWGYSVPSSPVQPQTQSGAPAQR